MQGWLWGLCFILGQIYQEASASPCAPRLWPAQFGGAADAVVNKQEAQKWHNYKQQSGANQILECWIVAGRIIRSSNINEYILHQQD